MNEMQGSRRLVAFLIDCLVFLGLAIAVLFPLTLLDDDRFRIGSPLPEVSTVSSVSTRNGQTTALISGTWISATCAEPEPVPDALLARIAPQEARRVLVCADSFLGLASGHTAYVDYFLAGRTQTGMQGNSEITVTERGAPALYSTTTDAAGNPMRALFPVGLLTFGLMWAVAAMGWPTPGKLIAGLRVESLDGTCRACRELRRLGPFILAGGFALLTGLLAAEISVSPILQWGVFGLQIAFWLFALWYYAVPFMTNAGRARYDLAAKFRVVLA